MNDPDIRPLATDALAGPAPESDHPRLFTLAGVVAHRPC